MPSIVPQIPLDLDRRRHLRMTNAAIFQAEIELSKLWGRKLNVLGVLMDGSSLTLNDVSILLWQALLWEEPTLTLARVQELMDMAKIPEIITAILQAWNAATAPAKPTAAQSSANGEDPLGLRSPGIDSGHTVVLS